MTKQTQKEKDIICYRCNKIITKYVYVITRTPKFLGKRRVKVKNVFERCVYCGKGYN